jgi:beta-glucosidase
MLSIGETVEVSVEVANKGDMTAEDVVQLYVSLPDVEGIDVPLAELKAFRRIHLDAGASETVAFTLTTDMFSYVDEKGTSVPYKGSAVISIGNASPGKRSLELGASVQTCKLQIR